MKGVFVKGLAGLALLIMTGGSSGQQALLSNSLAPGVAPIATLMLHTSDIVPTASTVQSTTSSPSRRNIPLTSGQWTYVTTSPIDGAEADIDMISLVRVGDVVQFWERITAPVSQRGKKTLLIYETMSCSKGVYRGEKYVTFDSSGRFIGSYDTPSRVFAVVPGSLGETILNTVCS